MTKIKNKIKPQLKTADDDVDIYDKLKGGFGEEENSSLSDEPEEESDSGYKWQKGPDAWSISNQWFKFKPEVGKGVVPSNLSFNIGKGLDNSKEYNVWISGTKVKSLSTAGGKNPTANLVFYNYEKGTLNFHESHLGKPFTLEFFHKQKEGKHKLLEPSEEYSKMTSIKSRSESVWVSILSHPDPTVTTDTIIPIIEDMLSSLRKKKKDTPDITEPMMELEQLLRRAEEEDTSFSPEGKSFVIEETYMETEDLGIPVGTRITSITLESGVKLHPEEDEPRPGGFFQDDDSIMFNEQEQGQKAVVRFDKPSKARVLAAQLIRDKIAPKLTEMHSLAHLVTEYVSQSDNDLDAEDMEGLPGMENGRSRDPEFFHYMHNIRSSSQKLEEELEDFTRYYMPSLSKLIQSGSTYFGGKPKTKSKEKGTVSKADGSWFKNSVRPIFEKADISLETLLTVAMDSFREGVQEFDYEKRDKSRTPDAQDFRINSNPKVMLKVKRDLRALFEKHRGEQKQKLDKSFNDEMQIPDAGGVLKIEPGTKTNTLVVTSKDSGETFTQVGALTFVASKGRGNEARLSLKGHQANGEPSPFATLGFAPQASKKATPTEVLLTDSKGTKFTRVNSANDVKESSKEVFFLTTSDNRSISIPSKYIGETFSVIVSGAGTPPVDLETPLEKNTYRLPSRGKIEFSPANGGEHIEFSGTLSVSTSTLTGPGSGGGDEDDDGAASSIDTVMSDEGSSIENQLEDRVKKKNEGLIRKSLAAIINDPNEKGLTNRQKVILSGIFGLNGPTKSVKEIAQEPPFSYDLSTKTGKKGLSVLQNTAKPAAEAALATLMEAKLDTDPELQKIVEMRTRKDSHETKEETQVQTREEAPSVPLFELMKKKGVPQGSTTRTLLKELVEAQQEGKSLRFLIEKRSEIAASLTDQDSKKHSDLVQTFKDSRTSMKEVRDDLNELASSRKSTLAAIGDSADDELQARIEEATKNLKASSGEDRRKALVDLKDLLDEARGKAPLELRKQLKETISEEKKLKKDLEDLKELVEAQKDKIKSNHKKIPALQAQKELGVLNKVQEFFNSNSQYDLGGGKYNLAKLFDGTPEVPEQRIETLEDEDNSLEQKEENKKKLLENLLQKKENREINEEREKRLDALTPEQRIEFLEDEAEEEEAADPIDEGASTPVEMLDSSDKGTRSLYDQLLSFALPPSPQQDKESRGQDVSKFRALMDRLKEFDGTFVEFIRDPKTPEKSLLSNESSVLSKVQNFLTRNASDIQTGAEDWDLSNLDGDRVPENPHDEVTMDTTPDEETPEALHNAQSLEEEEANLLHSFIRMIDKGVLPSNLFSGIKNSDSVDAKSASSLVGRLLLYLKMHPEARVDGKYTFKGLYSGEDRLPSAQAFTRSKPLLSHMKPLIEALVQDSEKTGIPESATQIKVKVKDMLSRMGEMVEDGYDLSAIAEQFATLDDEKEAEHSLTHLFQRVRNYLNRLNRKSGLSYMTKNFGIDLLFPEGAGLEDVADEDETVPVPEKEETPEEATEEAAEVPEAPEKDHEEWSEAFSKLVKEQGLDKKDALKAHQILESTQLRMEAPDVPAHSVLKDLLSREKLAPIVTKILKYFGKHRAELMSGFDGVPDLSSLTGLPFVSPSQEAEEEAPEEEDAPEVVEEPKKETNVPGKRGRLNKELTLLTVPEMVREDFLSSMDASAVKALTTLDLGIESITKYVDLNPIKKNLASLVEDMPKKKKAKVKKAWKKYTSNWAKYLRGLPKGTAEIPPSEESDKPVEPTPDVEDKKTEEKDAPEDTNFTLPEGDPVGMDVLRFAFDALGKNKLSTLQQGLRPFLQENNITQNLGDVSIQGWLTIQKEVQKGHPDAAAVLSEVIRLLAPASPSQAPKARPVAPNAPAGPQINLDRLKNKAVETSKAQGWETADQFGDYLKEYYPKVYPSYKSIYMDVNRALKDHALNLDMSDVYKT